MGTADLHIHTIYSFDGTAAVAAVLQRARRIGLNVIAITDHDELRGALLAEQLAPRYQLQVIPGVEITTAEGHLLALNIRKPVPAGLSLVESVQRTADQGGFCLAAHPGAGGMGMKSLSIMSIGRALQHAGIRSALLGMETYNATALDRRSNHVARLWARKFGVAQVGNSDAHVLATIGLGKSRFPGTTVQDLLAALRNRSTQVSREPEWSPARVIGKWLLDYLASAPAHLALDLAGRNR